MRIKTYGLTQEQEQIANDLYVNNKRKVGNYTLEEVEDMEMVNVWIADAFGEGDDDYAHFLQSALAEGAEIYNLTDHLGEFSQPVGDVVVYDD